MKFENTWTGNWKNSFRGLRNPMNSWSKGDSKGGLCSPYGDETVDIADKWMEKFHPEIDYAKAESEYIDQVDTYDQWLANNGTIQINTDADAMEFFYIGPNDMDLAQRMIAAGNPNDKFLRQIFVSVDITAPLYWWKEMDTYKVATTANSTSTMHKLATTPITLDCFETDDMPSADENLEVSYDWYGDGSLSTQSVINEPQTFIRYLEGLRLIYLETKDEKYWKELIRWLPESWLQTRAWSANYEILRNIYHWRHNHRLIEWHRFCKWIESLPYAKELILYKNI